jgi:hypothetical protein
VEQEMKLLNLDPRWLIKDGQRVGFVFKSPTLGDDMWSSCFEVPPDRFEQWKLFAAAFPEGRLNSKGYARCIQGMNSAHRWQIAGGIDAADFGTITVTPSLDGSAAGNWHGFITNGEIVGGI